MTVLLLWVVPGIVSWSISLYLPIKIEERKLKDKMDQKITLAKLQQCHSGKTIQAKASGSQRISKTFINKETIMHILNSLESRSVPVFISESDAHCFCWWNAISLQWRGQSCNDIAQREPLGM